MSENDPAGLRASLADLERGVPAAAGAPDLAALEALRVELLGRKEGRLNSILRGLKGLPLEERREVGARANELRARLEAAIEARRGRLAALAVEAGISTARVDATLPGTAARRGRLHPLTLMLGEITSVLGRLGFSWADGPHVELDRYNFSALNIPADHPARDMQDTFYLKAGEGSPESLLLRTHTSPVQIRRMESCRPPLRVMAPGRVFRHEASDATHSAVFHQVEGLHVDRNVSMADLKGTLDMFLKSVFGAGTRTRFRPSYFPFTEPSAEVDIGCLVCSGSGCQVCKRSGWLEVLGAGLVHPAVLRGVDYDPEAWSGFAFGLGVERFALLRYGIEDIRLLYQNDVRFLERFG